MRSSARGWSGWSIATSKSAEPLRPGDLPPHAYVPGRTPRHPEELFDLIKKDATDKGPPQELERTHAWQAGLLYFREGFFWECHEVLEAVWLAAPQGTAEREMVQAIIQLANARLKLAMARPKATLRLCDMVEEHLVRCPAHSLVLGQEVSSWLPAVEETRSQAEGIIAQEIAK